MLKAAWELLRDSGRVLLEAAPKATNLDDIRAHLLATGHVHDIHDLPPGPSPPACQPCRRASSSTIPASAMGTHPGSWTGCKPACSGHFDIEHCTFQLEAAAHSGHEIGTH